MAVSNQLRTSDKVVKTPALPSGLGDAKFAGSKEGLTQIGVPSAIALKGKKITNLPLAANY